MARRALEEKAEQLALTSKYKSEFLANMSHELRTPLNSLLILSKLLSDNTQGNLNDKQVEFARTINSAGSDLLNLINDILDLSKIESGTVSIEVGEMPMQHLKQHMERTFRQLAADKGLDFNVKFDSKLPRDDPHRREAAAADRSQSAVKRLQVHLEGQRHPRRSACRERMEPDHPVLRNAERRSRSRSRTPASASPRKSRNSSSRRSSRPTARPAANMAAPALASRSAAKSRGCSAGSCRCARSPAKARHSRSMCRSKPTPRRTVRRRAGRYDNSGAVIPSALPTGFEVNDDRDELGKIRSC